MNLEVEFPKSPEDYKLGLVVAVVNVKKSLTNYSFVASEDLAPVVIIDDTK